MPRERREWYTESMAERQLVSKRTVASVSPIPNADAIEKIMVDGWQVVAKKGEFRAGDECVYFEIDSLLPVRDHRFEFLARNGTITLGDTDYVRLRTIKLRGTLSQGLALPVSLFSEIAHANADLAAALGVVKFEPPLPGGDQAGPFPTRLVPKTDAERVQNLAGEWDTLLGVNWIASEKIDGTSCTVLWEVGEQRVRVCGRNWEIKPGDNVYWGLTQRNKLDELVEDFARTYSAQQSVALQMELFGPGIQGNPLGVPQQRVAVFNAWVDRQSVWGSLNLMSALQEAGVCAPLLDIPLPESADAAVALVDGMKSRVAPNRLAEGVVWQALGFEPVKAINNKFLLKNGG